MGKELTMNATHIAGHAGDDRDLIPAGSFHN